MILSLLEKFQTDANFKAILFHFVEYVQVHIT